MLAQIFVNVGILLSYVSNYALAGLPLHIGWRVMYAIGVLPPVFLAAGVLAMPESPRWLAMRGRQADARAVLVRTSDTAAEAELRLEEIRRVVEAPQEDGAGVWRELIFQPSAMIRHRRHPSLQPAGIQEGRVPGPHAPAAVCACACA